MNWAGVSQRLISSCSSLWHSSALDSTRFADALPPGLQSQSRWGLDDRGCGDSEKQGISDLVEQMLLQGRYALLMRPQIVRSLAADRRDVAESALAEAMAYVPAGDVFVEFWKSTDAEEEFGNPFGRRAATESIYLDRFAITNQQYQVFVTCGGYLQESLWHRSIWPRVPELTDQSGCVGPRFWTEGSYHTGGEHHPVVGVSWFEADAFARWVGKRLPTDAEWVKAASWPVTTGDCEPIQRKYPWGETMELARCNLWASHLGTTVPVTDFPAGASVNGVRQMIGNVWEWTTNGLAMFSEEAGLEFDQPLKSLRGGAFDTYFESQVSGQLQRG